MDDSQILLDSFRSALLCSDGTLADLHKWWRREYNLMYKEFVNENLNNTDPQQNYSTFTAMNLYGLEWKTTDSIKLARCEDYLVSVYFIDTKWNFTIEKEGSIVDSLVRHPNWECSGEKQAMFLAVRALTRLLDKSA